MRDSLDLSTDFLPHGGIELGRKHKPLKERKIDVLYAGALPVFTVAKMIPSLDDMYGLDLRDMMQEVLRELVTHPDKTTEQAIEGYVQANCHAGCELSEDELRKLIILFGKLNTIMYCVQLQNRTFNDEEMQFLEKHHFSEVAKEVAGIVVKQMG